MCGPGAQEVWAETEVGTGAAPKHSITAQALLLRRAERLIDTYLLRGVCGL